MSDKQPEQASDIARKMTEAMKRLGQRTDETRRSLPDQPARPPTQGLCQPNCPICGGGGYISYDLPVGDPGFGKIHPCPNLSVWKTVGNTSGLTEAEIKLNWTNLLMINQDTKAAKGHAESLIKRGYGWLTFWGEYGTAKTHMLKIITALILQGKRQAVYVRMSDLLDDLRSAYDDKNPNEKAIARLDWYSEVYCLAIDEFDRINPTAWATERRFAMIDRRYELAIRRQGITLLAMNTDPKQQEGYLADRILDGRFITCRFANQSLRPGLSWEDHVRIYQETYEQGEHNDE